MESNITITATDKEIQFLCDYSCVKLAECLDPAPADEMDFNDDTSRRWKLKVRHAEEVNVPSRASATRLMKLLSKTILFCLDKEEGRVNHHTAYAFKDDFIKFL